MPDSPVVVSDTGPLIALANIDRVELLRDLFGSILVPEAVYREVVEAGAGRPGAAELERAQDWAHTVAPDPAPDALVFEELGLGESQTIAIGVQRRAHLVLLDDRRARRIAEIAYHLKVRGVAGVLVMAKRRGLIPEVRPLLVAMRSNGYFLSDRLVAGISKAVGEL